MGIIEGARYPAPTQAQKEQFALESFDRAYAILKDGWVAEAFPAYESLAEWLNQRFGLDPKYFPSMAHGASYVLEQRPEQVAHLYSMAGELTREVEEFTEGVLDALGI